jgi:hypothetical protein
MTAEIEWIDLVIEALAFMTVGALLMYGWMSRRLDREVAAERRQSNLVMAEKRRLHDQKFTLLARDLHGAEAGRQRAQLICARVTDDNAQLTAENDVLRTRLAQTSWAVNAWGPKTERGRA